ncbi:hypothetical protein PSECIP111951_03655 [Pseudoalteromonas holothuriae]|uniref:Uncharacterized protein n=1 Tax=Pseudoalteromonas holothuriae TaxID=2963714 RepID=A0A9W4W5W0_9GAMM|nr:MULTISPECIES: hypothetical protein [unclassified Pseudoalteromonas]CAH9062458.1 hypothetical protein PSECIP111854_03016 [Pseudoalteromonas sp. CIP111854]CAH9066840.1 hypothetical protein PSECIP111951_03655 [Pseudoalteromonas sp. CIP111951]
MGLNQQTASELTRLGERLKKNLNAIFAELPASANTINGLTQFLNFHRSNSQRVFNAKKSATGEQVLLQLPGIKALEEFSQKLKPHISESNLQQFIQSCHLFAESISTYASSHADLKRQLQKLHEPNTDEIPHQQDKRAQLYYAAKSLLGFSIDHVFCTYILTRQNPQADYLQEVALISKTGIKRQRGAPPFVQFYTHPHPSDFIRPKLLSKSSQISANEFTIGIAKEYSTPGLEQAYSSYSPSNSGIVFDELPDAPRFDATFIFNNPDELVNPLTNKSQCSSTSISIKNPTKRLTLLVLLDKAIDRSSNVNVGCYHGNQKVEEGKLNVSDMWTERLPDFPELRVISLQAPQNLLNKNSKMHSKVKYLLEYANLDAEQFVCYLMDVDFPIWSATYRIYFEHS